MELSFVRFNTPALKLSAPAAGVALALHSSEEELPADLPATRGQLVFGTCRLPHKDIGEDKLQLPRHVFISIVGGIEGNGGTINLMGRRLVLDDDVHVLNDDYVCHFCCDLVTHNDFIGPYFLHAALHQYISNVLWVRKQNDR